MIPAEIAVVLGSARRCGALWSCQCPSHQDRSPSLSIRDGDRALIVKFWAGCDPRDVLAELRRRGMVPDKAHGLHRQSAKARTARRPKAEVSDNLIARRARARRLWETAADPGGTPVMTYLARRGITLPPPSSLRWAEFCWHADAEDWLPAMIAATVDASGALIGVHRTFLRTNGSGKADIEPAKMMLGGSAGGAVRLAPAADLVLVGEGIETCMAAMQATGLPAWAALSTSGVKALVLPPSVREVVILADHDASGAGKQAALGAGARWLSEGRRVRIAMPPSPGTDFADVLIAQTCGPHEVPNDAA